MKTRVVALGDICSPKQWGALPKSRMKDSGYPVYGANGVIGFADEFTHAEPTILVGCRGSIGAVHVTRSTAYATSNTMALDNLRADVADLGYLAAFLAWRGFRDVVSGTSQPQLTRQNMVSIQVPLPPLEEQRRIAAILDTADAVRAKRRTALAAFEDLSTGLFVNLLGDPLTNPNGWPVAAIGQLGVVTTGKTPPTGTPGLFGGSIPFVTPGDLESRSPAKRTLTTEGATRSRVVRSGATLVCCIGATIGKVGTSATACAFNQQINAVEWGSTIDDAYGFASLRMRRRQVASLGASTTLPLLTKTQFAKIEIPVPPLNLQKRFASALGVIRAEMERQQAQYETLDELFASLQRLAFGGES